MAWVKTCRDCEQTFASGEIDRKGRCGACRTAAAAEIASRAAVELDRTVRAHEVAVPLAPEDRRTLEEICSAGGWSSLRDLVGSIVHEVCADDRAAETAE